MKYKVTTINGLLVVDKPIGMVSKDVSRWFTKRLGRVKMGHVGTLDPAAGGVLPILFGRATRLQDMLLDRPKEYVLEMEFGYETDTLDLEGSEVRRLPVPDLNDLPWADLASSFVGRHQQTPPIYSAIKYKGKPLYEYARAGRADEVPLDELSRNIEISEMAFLWLKENKATFRVSCSKGTYIRSIVRDLSAKIGTCATLTRLTRTRAAGVSLDQARTLEEIEGKIEALDTLITPLDEIDLGLHHWRSLSPDWSKRLRNGQQITISTEEFERAIDNPSRQTGNFDVFQWARPVFLVDIDGTAFGMGAAKKGNNPTQVVISMKRGL